MAKGFGKANEILVESMVAARSLQPTVSLKWGKEHAQFTPREAMEHAFGIMEAAVAADLDACFFRWAMAAIDLEAPEAARVLQLFRQKRETEPPSCTMHIGDEHIRPETARQRARMLLDAAFNTELEAFLAVFLLQDLNQSGEIVDMLIQEFRTMRSLTTMWNEEEGDRNA